MFEEQFWNLIETSKQNEVILQNQLEQLSVTEIFEFHRIFQEKVRDAYCWNLWAVAYIMNGGCSDDGFDYFLGWLISRGRKMYEAALQNPEKAAIGVTLDDEPFENELLWYISAKAYEHKTGKTDFYEHAQKIHHEIQGTPFDEDTVAELYPKLAKKFEF